MKSLLYYSLRIPSINISSYHNVFYVSSSSFPKKESGVLSESTVQLLSRWLSLSMGQSSELMFASRIMGIDGAGVTIIYCAGIVSIVFWEQFSTLLSDMDVTWLCLLRLLVGRCYIWLLLGRYVQFGEIYFWTTSVL